MSERTDLSGDACGLPLTGSVRILVPEANALLFGANQRP